MKFRFKPLLNISSAPLLFKGIKSKKIALFPIKVGKKQVKGVGAVEKPFLM
jgi:hypothetical protein